MRRGPFTRSALILLLTCGLALFALSVLLPAYDDGTPDRGDTARAGTYSVSAIGHAGLYIGNNQFIHASSGGGKVQINSLSESYYNTHYYGARRIVS